MARVVRVRSRSFTVTGKRLSWSSATSAGPPDATVNLSRTYTSTCTDKVGSPVTDGGFDSIQRKSALMLVGTTITRGNRKYTYETYPEYGQLTAPVLLQPPSGWQLDLVAGTNPSRPVITLPEMAQNLIELPKLLRQTFAFLSNPKSRLASSKNVANDYLALKFGWLPFIKDLQDLLDLQSHVIKRNKELSQLYSGKGLRRRLRFGDDTVVVDSPSTIAFETPAKIKFSGSVTTKRESWGTARWHPTSPPLYHPDDEQYNQYVRRIILGATPEGFAKGAWAVIPWTWLLGWFTNVGKYTLAHSNTVPATFSHLHFMSKATVTRSMGGPIEQVNIANSTLTYVGSLTLEYRTRLVGSGILLPGLSMPYLDIGRLSVLGALTVQRMKR